MTVPQALELALQRHQAGLLADAEALYRQILAAQPNHPYALRLLGVLAQQSGRHDLVVEWMRQAIAVDPTYPAAHCALGEAYHALGRLDDAISAYRAALQVNPDFPEAHHNLGNALKQQGRFDEAIAAYRRALQLKPDMPEAHNNLSAALRARGQLDEAVAACLRALELKPGYLEAHNNLGAALAAQGRLDEAIAVYHRAIQLNPNYAEAWNDLGVAFKERGDLAEAIAAYLRALALKPNSYETHNNLGIALKDQDELDQAIAAFRRSIELKPDSPQALNNLGNALKDRGELDEAVTAFRRALQIKPDQPGVHSNLVFALHFHPGPRAGAIAEEHQRWNRQFSDPLRQFMLPRANDPAVAGRRLRIGYVSPDFRDHVVGRNLLPLFEHHDRQSFDILCYAGVSRPDKWTGAFQRRAQHWRSTVGIPDEALAGMIRQDGVDILVDLSQHTAGNRLPMFARQPAPVQVSFAGYPDSTGLQAIQYRISDRYLEPGALNDETAGGEHVLLIDSFWCYDPCGLEIEVNRLPTAESGGVTFGCLNAFSKVNEPVLRLWARVIKSVRDSRLILRTGMGSHRRRTLDTFEQEGVASHRVGFVEPHPRREYLALYHRLDIALDTAPYNGHTTSLDALWMGVPVVTLAGETPVSRAGLSQLTNLGLPELVAHSEAEYVAIAEALAQDHARLARLRSTLRDRMQNSVLMDAPRFARGVESAYRSMWRRARMKDEG